MELKCYDVVTDMQGVVGVVLPYPEIGHDGWCWFYKERNYNPLTMHNGVLYSGSMTRNPIATVHRAANGIQMRAIACYTAYKDKVVPLPDLGSMDLVYGPYHVKVVKLGEYDAQFVGSGKQTTLKVGCQEITYDQLAEAFKQFELLTKEESC